MNGAYSTCDKHQRQLQARSHRWSAPRSGHQGDEKTPLESKWHEKPRRTGPRHYNSSCQKHWEKPFSKGRYPIPETDFEKSSERGSNCCRHSVSTHRHKSRHLYEVSVTVIELANAYYPTVLQYSRRCLSAWSWHYSHDKKSWTSKILWRLEVQLKSKTFSGSDRISILGFLLRFNWPATQSRFMKAQQRDSSTSTWKRLSELRLTLISVYPARSVHDKERNWHYTVEYSISC